MLAAFGLGVILARLLSVWSLFLPPAGAWLYYREKRNKTHPIWLILLMSIWIGSGRWYILKLWEDHVLTEQRKYQGIEAVVENVSEAGETQRAILRSAAFYGRASVILKEDIRVGTRIRTDIFLDPIQNNGNPGEFDSKAYQRVRGVYYYGRLSHMEILRQGRGSLFGEIRQSMAEKLLRVLPQPESGLLSAILLGEAIGLEEDCRSMFQKLGISHILAISGLHVGMIYRILQKIAGKKRRSAAVIPLAGLWGYTILTGGAASTIRAAVICTISAFQKRGGGKTDSLNSLAASAWVLLVWNPLYILDTGFQLSFACTASLFLFSGVLNRWFWLPREVRRILSPTIAILIGSMPISLYYFYTWSPYQILLNLLILPAMGLVFTMGGAVLLLSVLWEGVGRVCSGGILYLLRMIRYCVQWVYGLPGAVWTLGRPGTATLCLYYLGWATWIWRQNQPKGRRGRPISWYLWGIGVVLLFLPKPLWSCTFLNVGQGDCCVLETEGKVFLIDAGPGYTRSIQPYLLSKGIHRIDGVWVSHGDWDHVEGLMELLTDSDFIVENWYLPQGEQHHGAALQRIEKMGKQIWRVAAGDQLRIGRTVFTCLAPRKGGAYADSNQASMVLRFSDGENSILFCGDLDQEGERQLLEEIERCDIMKVAHHGSATSSSAAWLERTSPSLAVISCDREGGYGHPDPEVVARLEEQGSTVCVTDDVGAIQVWESGKYWSYKTGR